MDGLEREYRDQVSFLDFNALDGADGERLFDQLGLIGHPSVVLFSDTGERVYQGVGVLTASSLRAKIVAVTGE